MPEPVVLCLNEASRPLAEQIAAQVGGAVHGRAGRVSTAARHFPETVAHLQACFQQGHPLIALCAAGIVIRALAPVLGNKRQEPPVLVVSETGDSVVPLLGGHQQANRLAQHLATGLSAHAAVTTAGDLRFGIALDDPPEGLTLANPQDAKAFMAALLSGSAVRRDGSHPWLEDADLPWADEAPLQLLVTSAAESGGPERLVYHPQTLALGVGCERGCAPEELQALVAETLATQQLAPESVAGVYSLDLKADEPAVHALGAWLQRPVRFFPAEVLEQEAARLAHPSEVVFREVGCHGVSEGAALAAAGPASVLCVPKQKSARATCALAEAPQPWEGAQRGTPQGVLSVVGTGPGQPSWRLPESAAWLQEASDWVGYGLYLDLVQDLHQGQHEHRFPLGEETDRVRHAWELAASGKNVALISSGDPGIYAMATLVFELLEQEGRPEWQRVQVRVAPGISALQAASARLGAPLGHDFCALSLSDLLTPREVIEQRVEAAAAADFVIAFYNPVSRRRTELLEWARDRLLAHRPAETPVMLARNLGRPEEAVQVRTLAALQSADVDMLTVVLVGSSHTRIVEQAPRRWVFTPRGYAKKRSGTGN